MVTCDMFNKLHFYHFTYIKQILVDHQYTRQTKGSFTCLEHVFGLTFILRTTLAMYNYPFVHLKTL